MKYNKIIYADAKMLYGHSMSQLLPYDETEMWRDHSDLCMNKLVEILNTPDDSDNGYFLEVDSKYRDNINEKTKTFPFCAETKVNHKDKYNDYMRKIKPKNYIKAMSLICVWIDEKNCLSQYRLLELDATHGMVVDKNHEKISFKQSKWLEKNKNFKTQK